MRAISLLYHDVVDSGAEDASGFPGTLAARYKLERSEFERHVTAMAERISLGTTVVDEVLRQGTASSFLLTFDDGGVSAVEIADALAARGWLGHFFITSGRIGTPGFVDADEIRALHSTGHVIGSHSATHPTRMSSCTHAELLREWTESAGTLAEILGVPVTAASVPGGYYARNVAVAAAAAGIRALFTSEPRASAWWVEGCTVFGRYTVQRADGPKFAAAIASGAVLPRLRLLTAWTLRKAAKRATGPAYERLRAEVLARR